MAAKQMKFDVGARAEIAAGLSQLSRAVKATLGPRGGAPDGADQGRLRVRFGGRRRGACGVKLFDLGVALGLLDDHEDDEPEEAEGNDDQGGALHRRQHRLLEPNKKKGATELETRIG